MKILIISNLFPPQVLGGYELLCGQVCAELARRGHDVRVLTSRPQEMTSASPMAGVTDIARVLTLSRPFAEPAARDRARRWQVGRHNYQRTCDYIARHRPEVIFLWSQLRLTVGPARAAEEWGGPVAYTFNDENIASYCPATGANSVRGRIGAALDRWVVPNTTLGSLRFPNVTCISHLVKRNLIDRGLPVAHAQVIRQGIPLECFPMKRNPGSLSTPLRVLYVGQLHPYKGVHTLISAAHRMASTLGPDTIEVTIVGGGSPAYVTELETRARNGPAKVRLVGRQRHDAIPSIYRAHDALVFPSLWQEPFGLTHLEAMASGTPVVSTADGGHGEFLIDGDNALVFDKGSVSGLSGCLTTLSRTPVLAQRLAHTARAMVERNFTLERYITSLEEFLDGATSAQQNSRVAA